LLFDDNEYISEDLLLQLLQYHDHDGEEQHGSL